MGVMILKVIWLSFEDKLKINDKLYTNTCINKNILNYHILY